MASFTNPTIHATGDDLAVTDYNAVANNTLAIWQNPYILAYNSVGTSLSNGALTQITLGGTAISGYGFSVSSNNIVVPLTGVYSVSFSATIAGAATSGILYSSVYQNGTSVVRGSMVPNNSSGLGASSAGATVLSCTASDMLGLWAYQSSGGSNGTQTGAQITYLAVTFVGSQ